jgi:hypothetical protein
MPFGLSEPTRPEDEEAVQQETLDGDDAASADAGNGADAPADNGQTAAEPYKRMSFRPDFLDDAAPSEGATTATAVRPLPQGDTFFVSVTRDGAAELHRFDSALEAQAFVEEQLGDGVQQEDVTAFSGRRLAFNVSHRPIVKLFTQED